MKHEAGESHNYSVTMSLCGYSDRCCRTHQDLTAATGYNVSRIVYNIVDGDNVARKDGAGQCPTFIPMM